MTAGNGCRSLWEESGGPAVKPAKRRGFGTLLITDITKSALQAEITLELSPDGLRWQLQAPAENLLQN